MNRPKLLTLSQRITGTKHRAQVPVIVFGVVTIHVIALMALLFLGHETVTADSLNGSNPQGPALHLR